MNTDSPTPDPSCDEYAALLPLLNTDELNAGEAASVRAHLAGCRWCQQQAKEYALVDAAVRRYVTGLAAPAPVLSLEEVVGRGGVNTPLPMPAPPVPLERRVSRVRRFAGWLAPVAAVLVIILLTVAVFSLRSAPTGGAAAPDAVYMYIGRHIYALSASDGSVLWQSFFSDPTNTRAPISSSGVVYDTFFGNSGDKVILAALRASDGSTLWESKAIPAIYPRIALANGVVYLSTSTYSASQAPADVAPAVIAFRARDGQQLWRYDAAQQFVSAPVIANGKVYIGEGPTLTVLRASDGKRLWGIATNFHGLSTYEQMAVIGDTVYLYIEEPNSPGPGSASADTKGIDAHLNALSANSPAEHWHVDFGSTISGVAAPPFVANGFVYLLGISGEIDQEGTEQTVLYMIRPGDGQWQVKALTPIENDPPGGVQSLSGPIFTGGVFYYSLPNGLVKAVQASNFKIIWQQQLAPSRVGAPYILGLHKGILFLQGQDTVWALRVSNGSFLWQQSVIGLGD
jgi:outer membrane protein assembly factor BamB